MRGKTQSALAEESAENKLSEANADDDVVDVSACGEYVIVVYVDAESVPQDIFNAMRDLNYYTAGVEKVNYTTGIEDVFKIEFWYE